MSIVVTGPWGVGFLRMPNDVAAGLLDTLMLQAEQADPPRPCTLECRLYRALEGVSLVAKAGVNGYFSLSPGLVPRLRLALCLLRMRFDRIYTVKVTFTHERGGGDGYEPGSSYAYYGN